MDDFTDALKDLDLSDRKTQLMLVGAALVVGLLLAKLRGKKPGDEGPESTFTVEYQSNPGGPAYNGTFPYNTSQPGGPKPADPAPGDDDDGWQWVDPTGKPYTCPAGSRMAQEKGGTGNHVCVNLTTGQAFPVTLNSTGKPWTPADDTPTTSPTESKYYCPSGSVLAKESNGSGNDVCRWPDGRETAVIMRATGKPWGVGGAGPDSINARLKGIPRIDTFTTLPAMLTSRREYTVQPGDTLPGIAGRILGAPQRWPAIMDANPQLGSQDKLRAGDTLRLP